MADPEPGVSSLGIRPVIIHVRRFAVRRVHRDVDERVLDVFCREF